MNPETLWWYRRKKRESAVAPTITSAAPAAPAYGVAYSHTYTATGTAPITWSVTAGALPTGLSLNAGTGAITGTPTASGAFTGTIRATNAAGYAEQASSVTVTYLSKLQSIAGANLVALYSLIGTDNPAADLSNNGYHGVISGATPAGGAAVPFPEGGNGMLFDGINDNVTVSAAAAFVVPNGFSVSMWIRGEWTSANMRVFASLDSGINNRVYVRKDSVSGFLAGQYYKNPINPFTSVTVGTSYDDTWTHVLFVVTSTHFYIYLNGVLKLSKEHGVSGMPAFNRVVLGMDPTTSTGYFSGSIAMCAFLNADLSAFAVALATP